jgi:hypothetical protein
MLKRVTARRIVGVFIVGPIYGKGRLQDKSRLLALAIHVWVTKSASRCRHNLCARFKCDARLVQANAEELHVYQKDLSIHHTYLQPR